LIAERLEISEPAPIGVVFESKIQVLVDFSRHAGCGREMRLAKSTEAYVDDRIDDELILGIAAADNRADFQCKPGLGERRRLVAELEIDAIEEGAFCGMGGNKQRPELERIGVKSIVLDRERQIEPDLPPVGEAIGEFRRAVDAVVGDQPARERRIFYSERD